MDAQLNESGFLVIDNGPMGHVDIAPEDVPYLASVLKTWIEVFGPSQGITVTDEELWGEKNTRCMQHEPTASDDFQSTDVLDVDFTEGDRRE